MTEFSSFSPPPLSRSLRRVEQGDLCAGCGACAMIAPAKISMQMRAPGFLRPHQTQPLNDAEEHLIDSCCPGLGQSVTDRGRRDDVLWGPYISMYTGHATDPDLRFAGSSGGGLSALLTYLLGQGLVDGVVQVAAAKQPATGNVTVLSTSAQSIRQAAGSRYAPSAPLAGLETRLASGKRYAFVGKPCDVAALRALGQRDQAICQSFPYMLSFFCAGVPSMTGSQAVLSALGTDLERTRAFRYRGNGWPGFATATEHDGTEHSMSYFDSWGGILSKHTQHRCKVCADGAGVAADVACADAWEVDERGYPLFEELDGSNLFVARTEKGEELVKAAVQAGYLKVEPFDAAGLARMQPGQAKRRQALLARLAGLRLMGRPIPRYTGLHIRAAARQNSLLYSLKNFLGIVRRAFRARAGSGRR